jgi:hypothetical protein
MGGRVRQGIAWLDGLVPAHRAASFFFVNLEGYTGPEEAGSGRMT